MTNSQMITSLVASLAKKIAWRMTEMGDTYAEAKEKVAEASVAGPAVWKILDEQFA